MRWVMDTRIVLSVGIGLLMAVGVGGADDRSPEVKRMVGVYAKQRSDALRKLNEQMIRKLLEIKSEQQREGELAAMGATWDLIERLRAENKKLSGGDLEVLLPAGGRGTLPTTEEELSEWLVGKTFERSGGDGTRYQFGPRGALTSDGEQKAERGYEVTGRDTIKIRWNRGLKVEARLDESFRWFRSLGGE